jgi:hypothetical protein
VFAGVRLQQTVVDGEPLGDTLVAVDPSVPASEFTKDNIAAQTVTLDRDSIKLEGGLILRLGDLELQAAYSQIVDGANIPAVHAFTFTTVANILDSIERAGE